MTTFDLLDYVQQRDLPEDKVEIYLDEASAFAAEKLIRRTDKGRPIGVAEDDRDAYEALVTKVKASTITLHLRGVQPEVIANVRAESGITNESEYGDQVSNADYIAGLLAMMARKAVRADDVEGTLPSTAAQWITFKGNIPESQWSKISAAVIGLAFASFLMDETVQSGFLAKP